AEALDEAEDVGSGVPDWVSPVHDLGEGVGEECSYRRAENGSDGNGHATCLDAPAEEALVEPPGPLGGDVLAVPADHVIRMSVVVCRPGYPISACVIEAPIPTTVGQLDPLIRAALPQAIDCVWDQITPTYPQLGLGFSSFAAVPSWFVEAGFAVAVIDARATGGSTFAVALSRNTTHQEITVAAGCATVARHAMFVGDSAACLWPGESILIEGVGADDWETMNRVATLAEEFLFVASLQWFHGNTSEGYVTRELLRQHSGQPPAGWKLVVKGGRKRQLGFDFYSGEVFVLAFQSRLDDVGEMSESESDFSHDPDDDPDDEDAGDGRSDTSTQSRTPRRHGSKVETSSDRSFHGSFAPFSGDGATHKMLRNGEGKRAPFVLVEAGPCGRPKAVEGIQWPHFLGAPLSVNVSGFGSPECALSEKLTKRLRLTCRLPDAPSLSVSLAAVAAGADPVARLARAQDDQRTPGRVDDPLPQVPAPQADEALVPVQFLHGLFLVATYETRPDVVSIPVRVPGRPAEVLTAVQGARIQRQRGFFPRLIPVLPQPACQYAVLLAVPDWPLPALPVLADCRAVTGVLHMALIPFRANRESILLGAGLSGGSNVDVRVLGQDVPLHHAQEVVLPEGALISFSESGSPPPATYDLRVMLSSVHGWDYREPLPFNVALSYWVLSDEVSARVDAASDGRLSRAAIAGALECEVEGLVTVPALPVITDAFHRGWASAAVFVSSRAIPRRRAGPEGQKVLVIDQRPVLQCLTWMCVDNGLLDLQQFVDGYANTCPDGYLVAVQGAVSVELPEGTFLQITDGLHIVVRYVLAAWQGDESAEGSESESDRLVAGPPPEALLTSQEPSEDFILEEVEVKVPCSLQAFVQAVSASRAGDCDSRLSELAAVSPQPEIGWALFLAIPKAAVGRFICLDTRDVGGRVFCVRSPACVDLFSVCLLAGISLQSEVQVFTGLPRRRLHDGEELQTYTGMCLSLSLGGECRGDSVSLSAVLETHLPWRPGPAFPWLGDDSHYWVCAPDEGRLFNLSPARSTHYRSDLAACVGLSAHTLAIAPACPRQFDVAWLGWPCRTVIAVSDAGSVRPPGRAYPVLVDCRALAEGWLWVATAQGWLHVEGLEASLNQTVLQVEVMMRARLASVDHALPLRQGPDSDVEPDEGGIAPLDLYQRPAAAPADRDRNRALKACLPVMAAAAFYLARTLLETLVEHFRGQEVSGRTPPVTAKGIRLADIQGWQGFGDFAYFPAELAGLPNGPLLLGGLRLPFAAADLLELLTPPGTLADARAVKAVIGDAAWQRLSGLRLDASDLLSPGLHCFTDGSFIQGSADAPAQVGWSCVFLDATHRRFGVVAGGVPFWSEAEGDVQSAFTAECFALVAAQWLCATTFRQVPTVIRADCISAMQIAAGLVPGSGVGAAGCLRRISSLARAATRSPPALSHVAGHAGCLANEIADVTAKLAARGFPCGAWCWEVPGRTRWWESSGMALDWAGLAIQCAREPGSLPSMRSYEKPTTDGGLTPVQCLEPFTRHGMGAATPAGAPAEMALVLASYNVLSLCGKSFADDKCAGLAFAAGRPALLAASLVHAEVSVAALQEARTEQGQLFTAPYYRFCSGVVRGNFGVELWFSSTLKAPKGAGERTSPALFSKSAFTVIHADPRRLLVRFVAMPVDLIFASLHAPHKGAEPHLLDSWWNETSHLLEKFGALAPLVLMGDFNAAVGSIPSEAILDPGVPTSRTRPETRCMISCIVMDYGFLPHGRLDYIALPMDWQSSQVVSWVDPAIHAGQPVVDHLATLVSQALNQLPDIPWNVGPDAHAAILASTLQERLQQAFPSEERRKRQAYLSDAAWALQGGVAKLRRSLARLRCAIRFHSVAAAFQTWRCWDSPPLNVQLRSGWMQTAAVVEAGLGARLQHAAKGLRAQCKADRASFLASLADDVQAGKDEAHESLKKLLGSRKKRSCGPTVLPQVKDIHGQVCQDPAAAIARWRQHFSALEAGKCMSLEEVAGLLPTALPEDCSISCAEFPAPSDLLDAVLKAKTGRACGPDGLPAEVGRADPVAWQRALLPLMLKIGLCVQEPLGLKSGTLTWLYKGRGSASDCGSYRAIMLLSTIAKAMHRAFRPAAYDFFQGHALPVQLGGLKRTSVLFGSHVSRAFLQLRANQALSSVILFADVSAAYYSATRALTARRAGWEAPPDANQALRERLKAPSALEAGGATAWLEGLTDEFNSRTWMTLRDDDTPVVTTRGSRPGSSWADIYFGVSVPGIVDTRNALRAGALCTGEPICLLWDGRRDFFAEPCRSGLGTRLINLDEVIWADDLAVYLGIPQPGNAAKVIGFEASALRDAFGSHGYQLSFGEAKTAAVVQLRGKGARAARCKLFSGKARIPVLSEEDEPAMLPLVRSYKHLGVRVAADSSLMPELKQRIALAWTAFRQGRTKVYRSRRLTVAKKGILLNAHVLSKLLFGAGAWGPLRAGEYQVFARAVTSMYRQCLCLPHDEAQDVSLATICALVQQPDPLTLLRVERLRYARQLIANGPDILWALLRPNAKFMSCMQDAFCWLHSWVANTTELGKPDVSWDDWQDMIMRRPGRFKGIVKRARALECARVTAFASLQALRRALLARAGVQEGPDRTGEDRPAAYTEACLVCKVAFPTRATWAVHAAKCHGYRAPATLLAKEQEQPLCAGCGKLFANAHRLRRHLLHAGDCRIRWGAFVADGVIPAIPHSQRPPLQVSGSSARTEESYDPVQVHPGLLAQLLDLASPCPEDVWEIVLEYVEPLAILKSTLQAWARHPCSTDQVREVAADTELMLDPELWCDDFRSARRGCGAPAACRDLLPISVRVVDFQEDGVLATFRLEEPPLPQFVYPFQTSVPLAAAKRHLLWLGAAVDTVSHFLAASVQAPVALSAPPRALFCLQPVVNWICDLGFRRSGLGFESPRD
ncbi:unnamed protein product, partial [Symbiodinium sp. CCMP2456]